MCLHKRGFKIKRVLSGFREKTDYNDHLVCSVNWVSHFKYVQTTITTIIPIFNRCKLKYLSQSSINQRYGDIT